MAARGVRVVPAVSVAALVARVVTVASCPVRVVPVGMAVTHHWLVAMEVPVVPVAAPARCR